MENLIKDIELIFERSLKDLPKKAVVTAGMPYANGPLHVGHLAGAHIPADTYARWLRMCLGKENVLFVCGTDDHGTTSEIAAKKQDKSIEEFISEIHNGQAKTMKDFGISLDTFTGTSRKENIEHHTKYCQDFLNKLNKNKMLEKKTSKQWFDSSVSMFLPDRYVYGTCPLCEFEKAYSEECDNCGKQYESSELINPKSTLSDSTPVLKDTEHFYLNMWKVVDQLKEWLEIKKKTWRKSILAEVMNNVSPSIIISNAFEEKLKDLKETLPKFKSRYAPGKKIIVQFNNLSELEIGRNLLDQNSVSSELNDAWAHRSITRDVSWGIPLPVDLDKKMKDIDKKTFYVWPESLIAPISFSHTALLTQDRDLGLLDDFWKSKDSKIYQFLGQDNVFFYVLMQGALWLGTQEDPLRQPIDGDYQLTEIFSSYHLQIDGKKMSKSTGNFYTADQLISEMGFTPDQVRYYLSILSLSEKNSNLDFENFKQRNQFLAGPLNAAFEKPISACHSKFDGEIPNGKLIGKTEKETKKIIQHYVKMMQKAEYSKALFAVENYARIINGLFAQFKPHDDRHDITERSDALYSCFYILKNLVIMLHPFAPDTMEKLRETLGLNESVYSIKELLIPINSGVKINKQVDYFPSLD